MDGLPAGLDTPVGERGEALSVGERQLVALARAYVADPDLLVLDEATSAVDPATEVRLQRALDAVTRGRTTVAIAHRLSTAQGADEVIVFDAGRIVQRGPHDDLRARADSVYARLTPPGWNRPADHAEPADPRAGRAPASAGVELRHQLLLTADRHLYRGAGLAQQGGPHARGRFTCQVRRGRAHRRGPRLAATANGSSWRLLLAHPGHLTRPHPVRRHVDLGPVHCDVAVARRTGGPGQMVRAKPARCPSCVDGAAPAG